MKGIIITGGKIPKRNVIEKFLNDEIYVAAADSGYDNALKLGLVPNVVIGDMDSVVNEIDKKLEQIIFPAEKDYTDTELTAMHIREKGITEYILIGGGEGRLDHVISLLDSYSGKNYPEIWITEKEIIYTVANSLNLQLASGSCISLFNPCSQETTISTEGLVWELLNEKIIRGKSSISNRNFCEKIRIIVINGGIVLVSVLT